MQRPLLHDPTPPLPYAHTEETEPTPLNDSMYTDQLHFSDTALHLGRQLVHLLLKRLVRVDLELGSLGRSLVLGLHISARPDGSQESIPNGEEWLAKVGLDTPTLMMNVMVAGIVTCDVL